MTPISKPLAIHRHALRMLPVCAAVLAITSSAWAATTEISLQPLATLPNVSAAPNLLFILDNSGSMASAYMPDDMSNTGTYGYSSAQCNGTAYDPNHTYAPPVDYTNKSYTPPAYPTAYTDGYKTSSGTHDVSGDHYYTYSGAEKRMDWTYPLGNGAKVDKTTVFYGECNTSKSATGYASVWTSTTAGSGPGFGVFTPVSVSGLTSAQQQNYVNWYSYYRTRTLMMRTSMGLAINTLDSTYNVGFTVISDSTATPSSTFLDVKSFSDKVNGTQSSSSQKAAFYSDLYAATGNSNTPLRGALSKAGQYYADKASGQKYDPMQYACQRNYALLSTDGYWNTGTEVSAGSGTGYGPYQMDDSTNVGNQDASDVVPMKDSSFTAETTKTTYKTATNGATRTEAATQTVTIPWTRNAQTTSATKTNVGTKKNPVYGYIITSQPQTFSETQTQTCTTQQQAQAQYTNTTVVINGVTTSSSNSTVSYSSWVNNGTATCGATTDSGAPTSSSTSWTDSGTVDTSTWSTTAGDGKTVTYSPSITGTKGSSSSSTTTSDSIPVVVGSYTAGTPSTTKTTTGGASDTLADIAEYYYKTDLRNKSDSGSVCTSVSSGGSRDVCEDDVPTDKSSGDLEKFQHMNTFTLGLGVSGTLPYDSKVTPTSATTVDWPTPTNSTSGGDATNVDDLWHAALNGRGRYYSVLSAADLTNAINSIVDVVKSVNGSGSAASTSSLELVSGDSNRVYKASYTTVQWTGDLQAYTVDAATATIGTTATWSAQTLLDNLSLTARKVYFNLNGTLTAFTYSNLTTAQKAYFDNFCKQAVVASQCTSLAVAASDGSTPNLSAAESGSNLVDYLAGARTFEKAATSGTTTTTMALYRARVHLLGDIVNGAPAYVGKPPFAYADAGYADFVTAHAKRTPVVYAAANDGMLHAFSAATDSTGGTELWAYVPTMVMPNLYKLANANYASNHQYFVDGAPVMGDVYIGGAWKTILVGGFNDGGQGYYALDITDPANPALLWEFSDTNLGLSYGNPVITKRQDGTWVVVFGSGYNNTGGDGNGHLFVVDAAKGTKLLDVPTYTSGTTKAGSTDTPSGLAKINAWVDDPTDNTSLRFYGGDLLGNLWRFDTDNRVLPNKSALLLASFEANGVAQPITTRPQTVAVGNTNRPVVVVATGRYLGTGDITNTDQQSIYAVADNLTSTGWGDPRSTTNAAAFVKQTLTVSGTTATITDNKVDFTDASIGGWYVDLPNSGERVFSNMALQLNTLVVSTAIPVSANSDACTAVGSSWLYYLDVTNGGVVVNNVAAGSQYSSEALVVGASWVKDTTGNIHVIVQDSKGDLGSQQPPVNSSTTPGSIHRTSWRELTN